MSDIRDFLYVSLYVSLKIKHDAENKSKRKKVDPDVTWEMLPSDLESDALPLYHVRSLQITSTV